MIVKCICDEDEKLVSYTRFNQLCDLYFSKPTKLYKKKNDSENFYLILSSMKHDKASILDENVSFFI